MDGDFTWLGIVIAVGSMLSLAYYLRVIAAIWMTPARAPVPAMAGGSPEADDVPVEPRRAAPETVAVACLAGAATLFFGVIPGPLLDIAADAGRLLTG